MKSLLTFILLCLLSFSVALHAQSKQNIVESLVAESDSTITIELSPSLRNDLVPEVNKPVVRTQTNEIRVRAERPATSERKESKVATRTNGYRIQIFSDGRNQETLQSRARARAKKILTRFPKYNHQVYSFSKAPNYYTRIGNFASRHEANTALNELRRAFPGFAGEMRVVSSEVIIMK